MWVDSESGADFTNRSNNDERWFDATWPTSRLPRSCGPSSSETVVRMSVMLSLLPAWAKGEPCDGACAARYAWPGLRLVICGSAAGAVSATVGAYYAGPNNKFWRVLFETGLTPRQLDPSEFRELLSFGIGLTDIVKTASGSDAQLPRDAFDVADFIARIRRARPGVVAFNGKASAAAFDGVSSGGLMYGQGSSRSAFPPVWILPSTSGAASGYWSHEPWRQVALASGFPRPAARQPRAQA
jgi:double-stranded uracil-DNA glycosylase